MKDRKKLLLIGVLVIVAAMVHFYSASASRVENGYSTQLYGNIALILRYLLGWLPFSAGDILYGWAVVWLIWKAITMGKAAWQKRISWPGFVNGILKTLILTLSIYIIFNVFWGINYNRKGIAYQLGLKMDIYTQDELKALNALLLEKVNSTKQSLVNARAVYPSSQELFDGVQKNYTAIRATYPFLNYQPRSLKVSLWGWLGNYTGFTGYYNPFTGEAQVNTTVPKFLQPFTACHEVAHQLGYAKEMEANFVGYLAASASTDTLFQYSVYLDMFIYSNRNLLHSDSGSARSYMQQLLPQVKEDITEWRQFNLAHKNPVEPVVRWMYGKYLQGNQQPQGVLSYDEVTGFLIAYYKKFGKL